MLIQNTYLAANLTTIPSFCLRHVVAQLFYNTKCVAFCEVGPMDATLS
jgi:hypothetical protein